MGKIIRMTLDEVMKMPLTKKEIDEIKNFDEKFDDPECPPLTEAQLSSMQPALHIA